RVPRFAAASTTPPPTGSCWTPSRFWPGELAAPEPGCPPGLQRRPTKCPPGRAWTEPPDMLRVPSDRLFDSSGLLAGVGRSSVRGGAISMAAQGVQFVLTFVGAAAMGRLLTPAEYGLVAMCMTTVGFVAMFKDAGLSTATI